MLGAGVVFQHPPFRDDHGDRLDVYTPHGAEGVPVVVFFHGGALRAGDRNYGDLVAMRLLPLGIGVVALRHVPRPRTGRRMGDRLGHRQHRSFRGRIRERLRRRPFCRDGVQVVEVPNRGHSGLLTDLNAEDDRIGDLIGQFIAEER
jgi:hypothetical protein